MFTGIIQALGRIDQVQHTGSDQRIHIDCGSLVMDDVAVGDSIAVNGVCLTATRLADKGFWADVSAETLAKTSLNGLAPGSQVNLEKALTPTTRLGGHLVSGHVDGLGEVVERTPVARSIQFKVRAPDELAKYIAAKGSICVDGISLTVNAVDGAVFDLNIVPHTLEMTTMQWLRPGDKVNLEVDIIARYLERLLLGEAAADAGAGRATLTRDFLAQHGFIK